MSKFSKNKLMRLKTQLKDWLPPVLVRCINIFRSSGIQFCGNYLTWEDAQKASTGYDSSIILEKVRSALLKVKSGEAVYERDSVLFDEIQYSWPLLAGLMFACAKTGGDLKVLDFGGSLGSTYYQNKKFLDLIKKVSWCIVEQKHFVEIGKKNFEDERLKFFYDIKTCIERESPNILLLSGVLQYVEHPYDLLDELLKHNFDYIIIVRTPFAFDNKEIITRQIVPPTIYDASYPHWLFSFKKMTQYLAAKYTLVEEFAGFDAQSKKHQYKGFVMQKIDNV